MTIFNSGQLNSGVIVGNAQQRLIALRNALEGAADLNAWASSITAADLEAVGFTADDAATFLAACADASALNSIYTTGLPPSSYPQPQDAYVYAASQRQVIGPQ